MNMSQCSKRWLFLQTYRPLEGWQCYNCAKVIYRNPKLIWIGLHLPLRIKVFHSIHSWYFSDEAQCRSTFGPQTKHCMCQKENEDTFVFSLAVLPVFGSNFRLLVPRVRSLGFSPSTRLSNLPWEAVATPAWREIDFIWSKSICLMTILTTIDIIPKLVKHYTWTQWSSCKANSTLRPKRGWHAEYSSIDK